MRALIDQFRKIQPKFSRFYSRMLGCADLTFPQYTLLLELAQSWPKPMTMTAVSQKLYISKPAVTSLVDRLEKRKFLKRISHPKDRRISLLEIQPSARKLVSKMQERILKIVLGAAKQLNSNERATIEKSYSMLSQNIDSTLIDSKKVCS